MPRYASETTVSCEKSEMEIKTTLRKYGAESFISGTMELQAVIGFQMKERQIRFNLPLPDKTDKTFWMDKRCAYKRRTAEQAERAWEQACRQRWRALLLCIKAKLEAVECHITTFEEEFMAHIVLPGGGTVGQEVLPRIAEIYKTGRVQPLLLMLTGPGESLQ